MLKTNKPFLIGITGGSGSGKTTFIRNLRSSFSADQLCIVSQDDYYHPREIQKIDKSGVTNFDRPKSIDKDRFAADLLQLLAGNSITKEEYVFNNPKAKPKLITLTPAPIIIVEGLFVFHFKKLRKLLDLKVFLHAKENLKVIRRIKRDQVERNYPLDDVLYRYENHVLPTFEKYILPYKDKADLVINNNRGFDGALEVFKAFVRHRLSESAVIATQILEEEAQKK